MDKKINRRQFLSKSAAVGAGAIVLPYFVPSTALGKSGSVSASNRITIGCIGIGGQGKGNMRAFLRESDAQVVAVCDVDASHGETGRQMVNKHYSNNDCDVYNDFRDLLARDDIDAVMIATPDHWHALIAIASAKAGKDIYCEKALANTVVEGRAICDAVTRYGRMLQTGSHERSNDSVRFAGELIRNGRIGKVDTIRIALPVSSHEIKNIPPQPIEPVPAGFDYDMWLGPTPWVPYTKKRCHVHWRWALDYGGGEMTDRGAHVIDLAQFVLGMDESGPVEIGGTGTAPRDSLYDSFLDYNFECKYANGVRVIGEAAGERGIKFEGSDGWIFIHIHGGRLSASSRDLLQERIRPDEIHLGRSPGHRRDFLDSVISRRQPIVPAETGHRTGTICHLINISMLTGQKLKWDPAAERVINSEQANRMLARPMRSPWHL